MTVVFSRAHRGKRIDSRVPHGGARCGPAALFSACARPMPDARNRAFDDRLDGLAIASLRSADDTDACGPETRAMRSTPRSSSKPMSEPSAPSAPRGLGPTTFVTPTRCRRAAEIAGSSPSSPPSTPDAEADLAVYRKHFPGLPPCTTANGCFTKVTKKDCRARFRLRTAAGPPRSRSTSTW